ncbi:MAG: hypothetical protein ACKVHE_10245 [Planctomycetales bacterium]
MSNWRQAVLGGWLVISAGCLGAHTKPVPAVVDDWRNGATHCEVHDRELLESVEFVERMNSYDAFAEVRDELFPFASNDLWAMPITLASCTALIVGSRKLNGLRIIPLPTVTYRLRIESAGIDLTEFVENLYPGLNKARTTEI